MALVWFLNIVLTKLGNTVVKEEEKGMTVQTAQVLHPPEVAIAPYKIDTIMSLVVVISCVMVLYFLFRLCGRESMCRRNRKAAKRNCHNRSSQKIGKLIGNRRSKRICR